MLGIAQLMLIIDVTVVAVALPEMGADLGLGRAGLAWVASIYALVFGGLMLLGGRAADVFGPRRLVFVGLVLFTAASLVAGMSGSAEVLLLARTLQGIGAAMMSPAALSIIVRTFAGPELSRALGVWSALGGAGAALGVLLGGVLTSGPGWPWVFYANVPLGAILLLTLLRWVRPMPGTEGRLDLLGAAIATLATSAIVFGLVSAGDHGWLSAHTLVAAAVGIAGYALFAWRIRTATTPVVDPSMLCRRPILRGLTAAGLAAAAGIASVTVLIVATSVAGFGIGAGIVAATGSLFSAVQPQEAGVASGALSTFHEFGAATGVSAVSSVAAGALLVPTADAFDAGCWFAAAAAAAALLSLARPKEAPNA